MTLFATEIKNGNYRIEAADELGTYGCPSCNAEYFNVPQGSKKMLDALRQEIQTVTSPSLRNQAESFCSQLSLGIVNFNIQDSLPEFCISKDEDEFYLEWIFDYYRFGFDFYTEELHSGWFVTIKQEGKPYRYHAEFNNNYSSVIKFALSVIGGIHEQ